jgi:hypothetical protein
MVDVTAKPGASFLVVVRKGTTTAKGGLYGNIFANHGIRSCLYIICALSLLGCQKHCDIILKGYQQGDEYCHFCKDLFVSWGNKRLLDKCW